MKKLLMEVHISTKMKDLKLLKQLKVLMGLRRLLKLTHLKMVRG